MAESPYLAAQATFEVGLESFMRDDAAGFVDRIAPWGFAMGEVAKFPGGKLPVDFPYFIE